MNQISKRLHVGQTHLIKARLIRRAKNQCQGCGYQFPLYLHPHQLARVSGAFELDHKIPLCLGGDNSESNFQVLCLPCHDGKSKGNLTDVEWRTKGKPKDWTRKCEIGRRGSIRNPKSG